MRWLAISLLCLPLAAHGQAIDLTKGGAVEVTSNNGMEWRQEEQVIIASGDARAVRGGVTVTADRLLAHYRKKATPAGAPAPAATPTPAPGGPAPLSATPDTGSSEIYRLEAEGHVHIFTATDQAYGDRAVYDIDQSVLVMTGTDMRIVTPQQVMRARDTMEYWSQKHMAVGRGAAVVDTADGRRLRADVLVGYTADPAAASKPAAAAAIKPVKAGIDAGSASGKLQRVDAFGHVEVRTATEIVHGDKGVYVPDSGIARLVGNVRLTRGQNELNGDSALINLRTGVSTLTRDPGGRVQGLVVPNDANAAGGKPDAQSPDAQSKAQPSAKPARTKEPRI